MFKRAVYQERTSMLNEQQPEQGDFFKPDFIIIPTQLLSAQQEGRITDFDLKLYGYIYWHVKLKGEKCFAQNERLMKLCGINNARNFRKHLQTLEKEGFIKRIFEKRAGQLFRAEIIPIVMFGTGNNNGIVIPPPSGNGIPPKKENFKKNKKIAEQVQLPSKTNTTEAAVGVKDFCEVVKGKMGKSPAITKADSGVLMAFLKDSSLEEAGKIFRWYVNTDKYKEYPTLRAALSAHSVNLFHQKEFNASWQQ